MRKFSNLFSCRFIKLNRTLAKLKLSCRGSQKVRRRGTFCANFKLIANRSSSSAFRQRHQRPLGLFLSGLHLQRICSGFVAIASRAASTLQRCTRCVVRATEAIKSFDTPHDIRVELRHLGFMGCWSTLLYHKFCVKVLY